jgi:uncharacterized membrane protein
MSDVERDPPPAEVAFSAPDRLVMFSDGVFAIAITLLALDLVPTSTETVHGPALERVLWASEPAVLSFAISFAVIGNYWIGHMRAFRYVAACNTTLIFLNLLLLGLIAFLPFPTAVLGDHGPEHPAVVFYALSVAALGTVQTILLLSVLGTPRILDRDAPRPVIRRAIVRSASAAVSFLVSAGISILDPLWAMLSWMLVPAVTGAAEWLLVGRHAAPPA